MTLSKKDYVGLAKVFNKEIHSNNYLSTPHDLTVGLLDGLCEFLRNDNERFDETKFRKAVFFGEAKWNVINGVKVIVILNLGKELFTIMKDHF